jgi:hypothetical protein
MDTSAKPSIIARRRQCRQPRGHGALTGSLLELAPGRRRGSCGAPLRLGSVHTRPACRAQGHLAQGRCRAWAPGASSMSSSSSSTSCRLGLAAPGPAGPLRSRHPGPRPWPHRPRNGTSGPRSRSVSTGREAALAGQAAPWCERPAGAARAIGRAAAGRRPHFALRPPAHGRERGATVQGRFGLDAGECRKRLFVLQAGGRLGEGTHVQAPRVPGRLGGVFGG